MITKKEDLHKTYVVNEPEIRGLYVGLCNKFGIEHETNANDSGPIDIMNAEYIEVYAGICFYTNMPSKETSRQLTFEDLIQQTKEVEWVNGEQCISSSGYKFTFIGLCNHRSFDCILMSDKGVPTFGFTKELSKPETEAERIEREEGMSAFELWGEVKSKHYEDWNEETMNHYLAIVRKTGYRVEK